MTGRLLTNVFNTLNQLTKVTDGNDGTHADLVYTIDGLLSTLTYPNGVRVEYGYDGGNRLTTVLHRVVLTSVVLISYTAIYDNGNRITSVTESPSGDVTSFGYDNADNLLSETRTGTKPYSGTYTYDKTNRRKTAVVVTNGTTTHNGTYTYDGAGRLTQVVDSATSTTEVYTWNNDGTLATSPGSGYTKVFGYDEEGHLTSIGHNVAGTVTTLYQYGYGADGNRRWRKDLAGNVWTWFPCGVACSAGELVEQTSDLTGTTWATSGLYLRAGGGCSSQLVRRNTEYHHPDLSNNVGIITNATGTILSNRLYDNFSVARYVSGTSVTQSVTVCEITIDETILASSGARDAYLPGRDVTLMAQAANTPNCHCGCKGKGGKKCHCGQPKPPPPPKLKTCFYLCPKGVPRLYLYTVPLGCDYTNCTLVAGPATCAKIMNLFVPDVPGLFLNKPGCGAGSIYPLLG